MGSCSCLPLLIVKDDASGLEERTQVGWILPTTRDDARFVQIKRCLHGERSSDAHLGSLGWAVWKELVRTAVTI